MYSLSVPPATCHSKVSTLPNAWRGTIVKARSQKVESVLLKKKHDPGDF